MNRVYNFSGGPAMLPVDVLEQAKQEMLDWKGSGMSVMEMSHRGRDFMSIYDGAENNLRKLLRIGEEFKILFLQGGASLQFAMVPLNLLDGKSSADYAKTGVWSKKAIQEAEKYCRVNVVANSEDKKFSYVPELEKWNLSNDAAYVHITSNETIEGVEYTDYPKTADIPLVADMSSHILSKPIDINKFGIIYAGAQKNIGPAGLTIVILREDLIGKAGRDVPALLDYEANVKAGSMYNTPPTFSVYIAGLVFEWLIDKGGLASISRENQKKADHIYSFLDKSGFYKTLVETKNRSKMNVTFRLVNDSLEDTFFSEAKNDGLVQLKGHRSVGGMRASIYNAMPLEGVTALVNFMSGFERRYG